MYLMYTCSAFILPFLQIPLADLLYYRIHPHQIRRFHIHISPLRSLHRAWLQC